MNNSPVTIRDIKLEDRNEWEILFQGYADFYQVEINDNITNTVWQWLHTPEHELHGLVGEINNKVIAFAHYRQMPSPLRGKNIGFLDDLYVSPEYRGQKIWTNLVNELEKLNIIIKLQSILNQRLLKFMIKCGWKKAINELSVYFIKAL